MCRSVAFHIHFGGFQATRVNKLFGLVNEILVFIAMLHMPKSSLKAHTDIDPAGLEV